MVKDLIKIFKNNFPFIVRQDKTVKDILSNKNNKIFERRDCKNNLIGVSVVNENTIILLCVNKEHRNKGIGSALLKESEAHIKKQGYKEINVGAGFDYLMPGVPTNKMVYNESLEQDNVYENVDNTAYNFFKENGYFHSWEESNCFDMRLNLADFEQNNYTIGETINGIEYSFAKLSDIDEIVKCTNDAHKEFSQYYTNENLYKENHNQRVLIAKDGKEVVGTLIISLQAEGEGLGSVGCTTVKHSHRGKHIGVNLVIVGTKYLKDIGLPNAFLGYTYSGLDKMYGYAGYKICIYYFMARKHLN